MRRSTTVCGLCALMLLGGSAWGAPRRAPRRGRAKPVAAKAAAPATEVVVSEQSATDIRGFGTVTTWTLRPNGTVLREGNLSGMNMGDPGQAFREHGTFEPSDFKPLAAFLESSGLLDLKVPKPQEMEGTFSVSVARGGGKQRAVLIPDSASAPMRWAVMKLVRGVTADVDWKNDAGFSVSTGLHVQFVEPADDLHFDSHGNFPRFLVRDAGGKEVAQALVQDESLGIRQPLPPGSYTITPERPADARLSAQGLAWRANPDKFQILKGAFTEVAIALEKAPAAP